MLREREGFAILSKFRKRNPALIFQKQFTNFLYIYKIIEIIVWYSLWTTLGWSFENPERRKARVSIRASATKNAMRGAFAQHENPQWVSSERDCDNEAGN